MRHRHSILRAGALTAAALALTAVPGPAHATVTSTPAAVQPSFNGPVFVIAHKGTTTYVGGNFSSVTGANGTKTRRGVAAYDNRTGAITSWNPNVSGSVRDIEVKKEGVYLVGAFSSVKGKARKNFARVDKGGKGAVQAFAPSFNRRVNAVDVTKSTIYVGGDFRRVNGKERWRLAAFGRPSGGLKGWSPKAMNGEVNDLEARKPGVYVAGEFREFNDRARDQRLTLVSKKGNQVVGSFDSSITALVLDIDVKGGSVFTAVGGAGGGSIHAVDPATGRSTWRRYLDGDAQGLAYMNGEIYVGGHFQQVCDGNGVAADGNCVTIEASRLRGASFNGTTGATTSWNPRANNDMGIEALDATPKKDRLTIGGYFTTVNNGTTANRYAIYE